MLGRYRNPKKGNKYILTVMCASTRFPEAVPLRNIKTHHIIRELRKFFSFVGLPKEVQSDQGSNFTSHLFKNEMKELGIKHIKSSAYHPQSQGALERFHGTLKNMLRAYGEQNDKDWDEGLHYLLFAARDSVQESLGYTPFELVFGHRVRGPLSILKEKWIGEEGETNLIEYISNMKCRLSNAWEVAKQHLKSSQKRMKSWYDQNTTNRSFLVGDKVVAFLPVKGQPLSAKFSGPFEVVKRVGNVNYVIKTPGRRKSEQLCHINALKPYYSRDVNSLNSSSVLGVTVVGPDGHVNAEVSVDNDCTDLDAKECDVDISVKLNNSDVLNHFQNKVNHLTAEQGEDVRSLINQFVKIFGDVPTRTNLMYHDVDVGEAVPQKQAPYRVCPQKRESFKKEVRYLLENGFAEVSDSEWASPCILVDKPDGTMRMCTDYRKVNSVTRSDSYPLPRTDDIIDRVGKARFMTKLDLLKGYYQIPLTERAKRISAFVTPDGLYQYTVTPFGLTNAPGTFQRLINKLISDIDGVEAYIDDILVCGDDWDEHLRRLFQVFQRLSEANLTVNLVKSEFGKAEVVFLGHVIGNGKVAPIDAKVQVVDEFPAPETKRQLMRFLGMAGYYRRFCRNFAAVAAPLTNLLKKKVEFKWTSECQDAFKKLKGSLTSAPVLLAPDFSKPFSLQVDASDDGIGAVLLQCGADQVYHPVCYFSRKLKVHQLNYSTIEKECLALVEALTIFEIYLSGNNTETEVFTDHNPLVFINKMKNKNRRLMRWSMQLQTYKLRIRHIRGCQNIIADALSRS